MEYWKDIPEYEGLYQASTEGRIRTHANKITSSARFAERHWKQRVLKNKWQIRADGRADARVELWKDGMHKTLLVARLVAMTWVDGYADGLTVNHKDGDSTNNHIDNLEWVTRTDNIRHGFNTGLYSAQKFTVLIGNDGRSFKFPSQSAASRWLGRNSQYVSNAIRKNHAIRSIAGDVYTVAS